MSWLPRRVLVIVTAVLLVASGTANAAIQLPQSYIFTPTNAGQVDVGEPVLITGGGYDGYGPETLTDYQVSVDGGQTWDYGYRTGTIPLGGETGITQALWAYIFIPDQPGTYTIVSRVNTETVFGQVSAPRTLYVGVPAPPVNGGCYQCSFYSELPSVSENEGRPVELGVRFRVDRPGAITQIITSWNSNLANRVRLWRGDGTLLADQAVPGNYAEPFPTPIPVVPGVEYVASFTAWTGHYRTTEHMFPATIIRAPFVMPAQAGVYSYDGGFPTRTWNDSHYWVTPEFRAS